MASSILALNSLEDNMHDYVVKNYGQDDIVVDNAICIRPGCYDVVSEVMLWEILTENRQARLAVWRLGENILDWS